MPWSTALGFSLTIKLLTGYSELSKECLAGECAVFRPFLHNYVP